MMMPPPPPPPGKPSSGGIELPPNINERVLESLERGTQPEDVWKDLMARGCSQQQADALVQRAMQQRVNQYASQGINIENPDELHKVGNRNRLLGALFVVGGVVITVASFASAGATGFFVVTSGLIAVGVTLFFRGQHQVANAAAASDSSSRQSPAARKAHAHRRRGKAGGRNGD